MTVVKKKFDTVNGYSLLNIRLWCYSLTLVNLLVTAFEAMSIDLTVEEDPKVRVYARSKWLLLTTWFNLALLLYVPLCIYCDWREKVGDRTPLLQHLRRYLDITMNSVLFPVTVYGDICFWILYKRYSWIIAPPRVIEIVPYWIQKSLHTFSFGFVIMDLVLTPRQRPKSDKNNLAVLYGFSCFYISALYLSYILGDNVYAFLETASRAICIQTAIISLALVTILYYAQWLLVDYVWGTKSLKLGRKSNHVKVE